MSKQKLIMIVDDEKTVRDILCAFLEKKEYESATFEDGALFHMPRQETQIWFFWI